jgi:hypothetical protein
MSNEETREKLSQLVNRASVDERLRNRLLNDPTALFRENGLEIPAGLEARVVADKGSVTIELPQKPGGEGTELTEGALSNVAGGTGRGTGNNPTLYLTFKMTTVFTT